MLRIRSPRQLPVLWKKSLLPQTGQAWPTSATKKISIYSPIPRLLGLYRGPGVARLLRYRSERKKREGVFSDIFDGSHYRHLCDAYVGVDGERLGHRFFLNQPTSHSGSPLMASGHSSPASSHAGPCSYSTTTFRHVSASSCNTSSALASSLVPPSQRLKPG